MKKKNARLFELLVVGGGLWIVSSCGQVDPSQQPTPAGAGGPARVVTDGGDPGDGGEPPPAHGGGSGFW